MNIIDATRAALRSGEGIVNGRAQRAGVYLVPTNTNSCYIVIPNNGQKPSARWNPHAEDILDESWELTE